jgi:S1-C subfamily serine protease
MVIGNPLGFGIHASTGFGTKVRGNYSALSARFYFYAPLFGGNSGGPIFNDNDEVIGIATMQSTDLESRKAYNIGLPMETVLNILEEALKEKPEVLKQINY